MPDAESPHLLDATMFWNPSGGVRRYVTAKRRWLRQRAGWWHTLATSGQAETGRLGETVQIRGLPLPGSKGAYRMPWRREADANAIRRVGPDLIEAGDPYRLAWSALDAARSLRIPAIAFCHSNLEQLAALAMAPRWRAGAMSLARRYARHLYSRFDLVLAPSRAMCDHLQDWGVAHAVHQPLGVDTRVFAPPRIDLAWRASLGLPGDARILMFAGRFAAEKHLATLVEATRLLGDRHWLVAIGAGPSPPVGERVLVLPPVTSAKALAGMLASADVFVHAGDQETFGLASLEAMACGVPVVARAAEGLGELVDASVGAAVDRGTPEAFAEAIEDVLRRESEPLRAAARARALMHDWDHVMPALHARYRELLAAGPSRSVPT
jgi:alpha-1,6-mannosyltransferase